MCFSGFIIEIQILDTKREIIMIFISMKFAYK